MIPPHDPELGGPPCPQYSARCRDCDHGIVPAECDCECRNERGCGACERAHWCEVCNGSGEIGLS